MRQAPLPAVLPALVAPGIGALLYFVLAAGTWAVPTIYGAIKLAMVAWPITVTVRWGSPHRACGDGRRLSRWRIAGEGLALGAAMSALIIVLCLGPFAPLLTLSAPIIMAKLADFHLTAPSTYIAAAVAISVLHSAFEEWYWRWFVFGHLRQRLDAAGAHVLAGLAFAIHHCVIAGVYAGVAPGIALGLMVGAAGSIWSLLYQRHRSLLGAWVAHACCDAALMWLGWAATHAG